MKNKLIILQVMTTSNPVMPQQVLAQQYQPNSMQFTSGSPYMAPNNTFLPQSLAYPVPPPQHTPPTQYPPQYTQYPASAAFNAVVSNILGLKIWC